MIQFYCLALLLLCGQVELFKFGLLTAPPAPSGPPAPSDPQGPPVDQSEYSQARQQYGYQQAYYGRVQQLPFQPYQPPALAYVIVRPVAPSYPYYDNSVRYWAPLQQYRAGQDSGVKGGYRQNPSSASEASTKGGQGQSLDASQQRPEQETEPIQQQPEPSNPPPPQPIQPEQLYDMGKGKLLKIKSHLDKLAASAKSKLTLGSSYYVAGEEIVPPVAPPQPVQQEQVQTSDIQLTRLEQQRLENVGQTKLEAQQPEENRPTKLEDVRQTKLEESRPTKQAGSQTKAGQQLAASQTKLEDTRQEKLTGQEPLRESKGLEQQQNQVRFNGQQPTAYLADSDGFGKRNSAI